MLAARAHQPLPKIELTTQVNPGLARKAAGHYGSGVEATDLREHEGRLLIDRVQGGFQVALVAGRQAGGG